MIEDPVDISRHEIVIARNGWGYTSLELKAEGDFLRIEKERASEYDFLGNTFRLVFYIDSERLHAGRNFGSICISDPHRDITIPVTVVRHAGERRFYGVRYGAYREKKSS